MSFLQILRHSSVRSWARIVAGCCVFLPSLSAENPRSVTEEQLRPVLIFQVAQYVNWSDTKAKPGEALRFCVLDNSDLANALTLIVRGKSIQDRPVSVFNARSVADLSGCNVAFIGISRAKSLSELFAHWVYPPMLVVGEAQGFAELGGMINLKVTTGKIGLQVNVANVERAGLKVRSQLLQLAQLVSSSGVK